MLTDALAEGGLQTPQLEGPKADELREKLHPGSSVANPIDILATGTEEQLALAIDYCEKEFDEIDGMIVIFGTPGLFKVNEVYRTIDEKMKTCRKPIYPVLPSVVNAREEIDEFLSLGRINFPDEVRLGRALSRVFNTGREIEVEDTPVRVSRIGIRKAMEGILETSPDGYLSPEQVRELLDAAGISRSREAVVSTKVDAVLKAEEIGLPVVMKVVGPVHKSDVGGVVLNVESPTRVSDEFERMMEIENTQAVLIQPMLSGIELFAGAKRENKFGHMLLCGMGGIFVETLKDVSSALAPLSMEEAFRMIRELRSHSIIKGTRGQEGVDEESWADILVRLSQLVEYAPEIAEMDLNPLLGKKDVIIAVDARIRVEKPSE
jgi:acetyltransferase